MTQGCSAGAGTKQRLNHHSGERAGGREEGVGWGEQEGGGRVARGGREEEGRKCGCLSGTPCTEAEMQLHDQMEPCDVPTL